MFKSFKHFVRGLVPVKLRNFLSQQEGDQYSTKVYSQEGEDILLKRIFDHSPPGFYVDIGAHHPYRFSNTKLLYDLGWKGINIEPNPDVADLFKATRPRDLNLSLGVSATNSTISYYRFSHPALNTFSKEVMESKKQNLVDSLQIKTQRLEEILDEHLSSGQKIDLMTLDTEGLDMEILGSNNWSKYRPKYLIVEVAPGTVEDLLNDPMHLFLKDKGYSCYSKLSRSALYVDNDAAIS